jgi:hypothetical protein
MDLSRRRGAPACAGRRRGGGGGCSSPVPSVRGAERPLLYIDEKKHRQPSAINRPAFRIPESRFSALIALLPLFSCLFLTFLTRLKIAPLLARFAFRVSRFAFRVSRFAFRVSRFAFRVSRFAHVAVCLLQLARSWLSVLGTCRADCIGSLGGHARCCGGCFPRAAACAFLSLLSVEMEDVVARHGDLFRICETRHQPPAQRKLEQIVRAVYSC